MRWAVAAAGIIVLISSAPLRDAEPVLGGVTIALALVLAVITTVWPPERARR